MNLNPNTASKPELMFLVFTILASFTSYFLLIKFGTINTEVSKNLADSRTIDQKTIQKFSSVPLGKISLTEGSVRYSFDDFIQNKSPLLDCKNSNDAKILCSDFIFVYCNKNSTGSDMVCLQKNSAKYLDPSWKLTGSVFSQKIRFTHQDNKSILMTVIVWWMDSAGDHNSPLSKILIN